MKHLKKKFLRAWKADENLTNVLDSVSVDDESAGMKFVEENKGQLFGFIRTDGGEMIQGFEYRENSHFHLVPEPNPIVTYFEMARQFSNHSKNSKSVLLKELNSDSPHVYEILNEISRFYAESTISATFLFISLEAFINLKLPTDLKYPIRKRNGEDSLLSKQEAVDRLPFEIKAKDLMFFCFKKGFHIDHSHIYEDLLKLKYLRDNIVHTKVADSKNILFYSPIIVELLETDFSKYLLATRKYINYYEPNLIEECDCGKDI